MAKTNSKTDLKATLTRIAPEIFELVTDQGWNYISGDHYDDYNSMVEIGARYFKIRVIRDRSQIIIEIAKNGVKEEWYYLNRVLNLLGNDVSEVVDVVPLGELARLLKANLDQFPQILNTIDGYHNDFKQFKNMVFVINQYKEFDKSLDRLLALVSNLKGLHNSLKNPTEDWKKGFNPAWERLNQIYSLTCIEKKMRVGPSDQISIIEIVDKLMALVVSEADKLRKTWKLF